MRLSDYSNLKRVYDLQPQHHNCPSWYSAKEQKQFIIKGQLKLGGRKWSKSWSHAFNQCENRSWSTDVKSRDPYKDNLFVSKYGRFTISKVGHFKYRIRVMILMDWGSNIFTKCGKKMYVNFCNGVRQCKTGIRPIYLQKTWFFWFLAIISVAHQCQDYLSWLEPCTRF